MIASADLVRFLAELDEHGRRLAALAAAASGALSDEARSVVADLHTAREELWVQHEELTAIRAVAELSDSGYDRVFSDAPTAYVQTDRDGAILAANRAASELMTWPPFTWSRRPLVAHFTLPTRGAVRAMISRASRGEGRVTGEAVLRRTGDLELPVHLAVLASPSDGTLRWAVLPTAVSGRRPDPVPARSQSPASQPHAT